MGGDLCHHGAEIRPSPLLPLPSHIQLSPEDLLRAKLSKCPGSESFKKLNEKYGRAPDEPLFQPVTGDVPLAIQTIKEAQEADAADDVFFVFAHDPTIRGVVELYPSTVNDWKKQGYKKKTLWTFLADLAPAAAAADKS